ncbi:hypothetical protein ACPCJU_16900 [Streptomyces thermodiastaticus]
MRTYAVRGATRKMTGHYRRPGTRTLYCGRPAGTPNDHARELTGFTLCAQCIKAEAAERAAAEQADTHVATVEDTEAMYAVRLVTEAEATDGTWRGEWIGAHTTPDAPALFDVDEQGALFT